MEDNGGLKTQLYVHTAFTVRIISALSKGLRYMPQSRGWILIIGYVSKLGILVVNITDPGK
jgi:uncharacterized protein YebE (UPF0316 family)